MGLHARATPKTTTELRCPTEAQWVVRNSLMNSLWHGTLASDQAQALSDASACQHGARIHAQELCCVPADQHIRFYDAFLRKVTLRRDNIFLQAHASCPN
jgi:hypothetical protein